MKTPKHHVLGYRYSGKVVQLTNTASLELARLERAKRLNPRRFQFIIITQGYTY